TYYETDDEVIAAGNVRIARQGQIVTGPELRYRFDVSQGEFVSPRFALPLQGGVGSADRIELLGANRMTLTNGTYTTCEPDDPDWFIQAQSLMLDPDDGVATGRWGRLVFMGYPILASPWLMFSLGDERRSGFLTPSLSVNSRTGIEARVPYYWNIAPNRDLTLFPVASTRRGLQLGGEYRYLEPNYSGRVIGEFLPRDQATGTTRYRYDATHTFANLYGWYGGWTLRGVSDDRYFIDWSRNIVDASQRSLPRELVAYRGFGEWTLLTRVLTYQNILEARGAPPYHRVPQLQIANTQRDLRGIDLAMTVDINRFERPLIRSPEGWRLIANPAISYPIRGAGWFLTPRVSLHATSYQLDDNLGRPTSLQRVVPTYSIDSGLIMERDVNVLGRGMIQTLEPRLFYVRTPFRDQIQIPIFDAAPTDFNFAQIFSENLFTGGDRIADVNQLTPAVVSRLIEPETGGELLRFAVAQRLHFSPQRVTIPGVPARTDSRSDLLLAASGDLGRGHGFDTGLQWALRDQRVPRFSFVWRYWPAERRLFNAGIRYQRQEFAQFDTSWRWPIGGRWSALGRINYSFLQQQFDPALGSVRRVSPGIIESVLGFEYDACCWTLRVVGQRFTTAQAQQTTAFFIQLELRGVGRIGLDPFDIF
ncbi:MAG TPA: LPS-assembly protein LptD, partial [Burkholderiaceae bacterium]|nr:LPS-assembly protein LptD [Burkholderiaceae bacterium]